MSNGQVCRGSAFQAAGNRHHAEGEQAQSQRLGNSGGGRRRNIFQGAVTGKAVDGRAVVGVAGAVTGASPGPAGSGIR